MFKNYLKILFRNLAKEKVISIVNIVSLTIGITSAFLIYLYVISEMSYDDFHDNKDRIVRLTHRYSPNAKTTNHFARVPGAWQPWMKEFTDRYPEIEKIARLTRMRGFSIRINENLFSEEFFFKTDSNIFDVFSVPLIAGDKGALDDPYSIIITESLAKKYFGSLDIIGKSIETMNMQNRKVNYQITGIMKDWPVNSHIEINFLASNPNVHRFNEWAYTYFLLTENVNPKDLEEKFPEYIRERFNNENDGVLSYYLQPVSSIHLHSHLDRELKMNGNITAIYILISVAILIIIVAIINYVNLNISRLLRRIKEIGIRRSIGASRQDILYQFLFESMLKILFASAISIILIALILPQFNLITGQTIVINLNVNIVFQYLIFLFGLTLFSGLYPAYVFSRINPVQNLNTAISTNRKSSNLLNYILITLQLAIAVFLIIFSSVMNRQMNYIHNKPLGMDKEYVISLGKNIPNDVKSKVDVFRSKLINEPDIINICGSMENPSYEVKDMGPSTVENIREAEDAVFLYILPVDKDFFDLLDISFVAGKNFSQIFSYDGKNFGQRGSFLEDVNSSPRQYIINEKALSHIGFSNAQEAIGKTITWSNSVLNLQPGPIVGVVKDFHFSTLEKDIKPFVMVLEPRFFGHILVKISPDNISSTIHKLQNAWIEMFPDQPFEYYFLDELFDELYKQEENLNNILFIFTAVAIIISCLGLFAIVMNNTEKRIKEIGVRKVLGATVKDVWMMLVMQYIKFAAIANIISWPIAYYYTKKWLLNYAYRINYTLWIFPFAAAVIITITLLTVSWQSIGAAKTNPVKTLKYE